MVELYLGYDVKEIENSTNKKRRYTELIINEKEAEIRTPTH